MTIPTIFETCRPRADVLRGAITEADFAADLAQVIVGKGNEEYLDPGLFFANTYPARGLKNLLANVCRRLTGAGGEVASIFRLDTSYGGIWSSDVMPPGTDVQPLGHREYGLLVSGMTERLRVTTDPEYSEEHAESLELWSPVNPLFILSECTTGTDEPPTDKTLKDILDG